MAYELWRVGGGDWLEPFRVYNALDRDLLPIGRPDLGVQEPRMPEYRHFMYGAAKHHHVIVDGFDDTPPPGRVTPPRTGRR